MASLRLLATLSAAACLASGAPARPNLTEWEQGQADAAAEKKSKVAKQAKMAAVDKVVSMLENLQAQVLAEGEKEAATYNKFSCFCKDTTAEKSEAIETGTDRQSALSATVAELSSKRDGLDKTIAVLMDDTEKAEREMKDSEETRAGELKVYEANAADLSGALTALDSAIKVLKASKAPSLVQFQTVAMTVRQAVLLADALSIGGQPARRASTLFMQQAPDVPMEDYNFHSNDIIKTLEELLVSFRDEKNKVDADEVKAVAAHKMFVQQKTDYVKQKNIELEDAKKEKDQTQEEIAATSEELTTVSATLLDDQQYLKELAEMCKSTAKTWDQRSKVRADELSALTAAIAIVKDYVGNHTSAKTVRFAQQGVSVRLAEAVAQNSQAMEAMEADAEEIDSHAGVPIAFLQRRLVMPLASKQPALISTVTKEGVAAATKGPHQEIVAMLRSKGKLLKSTLLTSLAERIAADPFAKVKQLIQELIERLLQEASNEANQKGWCDKATADATQKRDLAASAIDELNGHMAELEATIGELKEEIKELAAEIEDLQRRVAEAEKLRSEEKVENAATVAEAKAGQDAVEMAIDILSKFYKTVDDAQVDLSLAQKGPADDAPSAGFAVGEAYTGAQGTAVGIIGMLDVIKSDFVRTITETEDAEAQAEQNHLAFMTDSGASIAEKTMAQKEKTKYKDDAEEKFVAAEEDLASQTETLATSIKELMELKPVCVDTGMSYEERVARREQEIEALNKAICILEAYAKFGPDGTHEC